MRLLTVVGARPQFIKAAIVSRVVAQRRTQGHGQLEEHLVHTGQHYDDAMSGAFFREMELPSPAVNLEVGSGLHGEVTGAMLAGIEREIVAREPDWVLLYGDTNSTLAGALAAAKLGVPIAHVEAGLRSFNRKMPEEINRVLTDRLSTLLFCPSEASRRLLAMEGLVEGVEVVGDVMHDAVLHYRKSASRPDLGEFGLVTLHRAENTDDRSRLSAILRGLAHSPVPLVLPLHPRTEAALGKHALALPERVQATDPLGYLSMLGHLDACRFVVTDSGGLQKEAYYLGKRCITVRDETEWTELVDLGANRVVGAEQASIRDAFGWALQPLAEGPQIYGSGDAGARIVDHLLSVSGSLVGRPPAVDDVDQRV